MTDKEFMMNYQQANSTILNIGKIIDDLKEQNFQLQAEISRLNQCTGTPKNPHNHSAEIKADSAQIDQNNKWIKQLDKLHKGISDLKALAQATDQKLVAYLEKMMNDRNISKDNEDIIADKQRINDLQKQIHNAENNPHIPPEQVDAMLKEVENCKNDIKLKQCSIDQLEKDNFSKQIEQAKLGGANSMQIDAMTAELNAKAEQVKQQIQDIQKEALQKVQAPEATTLNNIKVNQAKSDELNKKGVLNSGKEYALDGLCSLIGTSVEVQNDGGNKNSVIVTLNEKQIEQLLLISNEKNIDPTLIIAIIAHESKFDSNAVNKTSGATGLMQIMPTYWEHYRDKNINLIENLGGDIDNLKDPTTNICIGSSMLEDWINCYGDSKDSLCALRQGYKDTKRYPETGWSKGALENADEFLDIKTQLDNKLS